MNRSIRVLLLPSLTLSGVLVLGACGASDSSPGATMPGMGSSTSTSAVASPAPIGTPAAGEKNDADVAFATQMVPHHLQAVQMAEMAATRASSPQVTDLAARIKAAQAPEIAQMSGWLTGWGAAVPTDSAHGSMGDMGAMGDDGMMSDQDMQMMGQATGTAFDVMFLTGMTAHHKGAVAQAQTELEIGANDEAKTLAQSIVTSQNQEIAEMAKLLTVTATQGP